MASHMESNSRHTGLRPRAFASRYPTSVATLSRRSRDIIEAAFEQSSDAGAASPLLGSRFHDFGFRGCTCVEQTVLGGCAHLLNFDGTDTLSASYYAQVGVHCWAREGWVSLMYARAVYVGVWSDAEEPHVFVA